MFLAPIPRSAKPSGKFVPPLLSSCLSLDERQAVQEFRNLPFRELLIKLEELRKSVPAERL